jgi:hypothetical protein
MPEEPLSVLNFSFYPVINSLFINPILIIALRFLSLQATVGGMNRWGV